MTRIAVPLAMLAIGAAGVPTATHSTCADNGCTVHKQTAWRCQCNLYCYSHGDCCPDVTDACFNGTKPVDPDASPPHNGEASHTRARNTTEPIHASPKPHVARHHNALQPVSVELFNPKTHLGASSQEHLHIARPSIDDLQAATADRH